MEDLTMLDHLIDMDESDEDSIVTDAMERAGAAYSFARQHPGTEASQHIVGLMDAIDALIDDRNGIDYTPVNFFSKY
jgi:hypothetical protein